MEWLYHKSMSIEKSTLHVRLWPIFADNNYYTFDKASFVRVVTVTVICFSRLYFLKKYIYVISNS